MAIILERQDLDMQYTNKSELMVAVEMITYNHQDYIKQAIESVLMQKTNFRYKIIICEDCSTDNTAKICQRYKDRFPDKIDLHLSKKNLGVELNSEKLHNESFSSGAKYIACLEGDDYWTDTNKLQNQVDFLEANTDYAISFHRVYELVQGKSRVISTLNTSEQEETYTVEDLAKENFIHTPSVVFRNGLINLPEWFYDSPVGDYPIHMLNARHGKIKYFPQPMAVYRRHSGGIWSLQIRKTQFQKWIKVLDFLLTEDFTPVVKDLLLNQKKKIYTNYLQNIFDSDRKVFLNKLETIFVNDKDLAKQWLIDIYPKMIDDIKQSKSYRLARKLSYLKNRFFN